MAGKTWRLKDLAGRATLINVWATWCGPCQAELPHIEKLHQMTKERTPAGQVRRWIEGALAQVADPHLISMSRAAAGQAQQRSG